MKSHQEIPEKTYSNLHNKKNKISLEKDYTLKQNSSTIKSNSKNFYNADFNEIKNTNNTNNINNNIITFSVRNYNKEIDNENNNNNNMNKLIYNEINDDIISNEKKLDILYNNNLKQIPNQENKYKRSNLKESNSNNEEEQNQSIFNYISHNTISKKNCYKANNKAYHK
jgi:hypothetical protein